MLTEPRETRGQPPTSSTSSEQSRVSASRSVSWLPSCCADGTLKLSMGVAVQLCFIASLFVLVVSTALLFNYYALILINQTANTYLGTAADQAKVAVSDAVVSYRAAVGRVAGVLSDSLQPDTWDASWELWNIANANVTASWSVEVRAAYVAGAVLCNAMALAASVRFAHVYIRNSTLIGGCIRPQVLQSSAPWVLGDVDWLAPVIFVFDTDNVTSLWADDIAGITDTPGIRTLWMERLRVLLQQSIPRSAATSLQWLAHAVAQTAASQAAPAAVKASPDVEWSHDFPAGATNGTWVVQPAANGTLVDVSIAAVSAPAGSVVELLVCNASATALLVDGALEPVGTTMSQGVSIDLVDAATGAVVAWWASSGYFVEHAASLEVPLIGVHSALAGVPVLYKWVVRVDSGSSIVGSLSQGTTVVFVVSLAIAVAVSMATLFALRLLLNPLAHVRNVIQSAALLKFSSANPSKFPPSILAEMNLVTQSFLRLLVKLRSYRNVLLDAYDASPRSPLRRLGSGSLRSSVVESLSTSFASTMNSADSFAFSDTSSVFDGDDSSSSFSSLSSPTSSRAWVDLGDDETTDVAMRVRDSFKVALAEQHDSGSAENDAEQHVVKVQLAYVSRRHKGRQRQSITMEHTYSDGDVDMLHKFRKDCLRALGLNVFEEVQLHVMCNGVFVVVSSNAQLADAISMARGELVVKVLKCSVKKILSPVALLVDLINFIINIALIALAMQSSRAGTASRLSITVFCGMYCSAFLVNLLVTLLLLKEGQKETRMREWLSQAGLEVSLMLVFCSLNTQHIHFLWSQWSKGLKFNAPRSHRVWKLSIQYSVFGFVFLDLMQLCYKSYRVLESEEYMELSACGLLVGCVSIALSLKKRVDFVVVLVRRWWHGTSNSSDAATHPQSRSDAHGPSIMTMQDDASCVGDDSALLRRPRAGLSSPMQSEDATILLLRHKCGSDATPCAGQSQRGVITSSAAASITLELNRFLSSVMSSARAVDAHILFFFGSEIALVFNFPKAVEHHVHRALKFAFTIKKKFDIERQGDGMGLTTNATISVALVRDTFVFGTLGSSSRKTLQCFADWDQLGRMLDVAESAQLSGVVTTRSCAALLNQRGHGVVPIATPHKVLTSDQYFVELRAPTRRNSLLARRNPARTQLSAHSAVLRCLGVAKDEQRLTLRILTEYATAFLRGNAKNIPAEEGNKRYVRIGGAADVSTDPLHEGGSPLPRRSLPSALRHTSAMWAPVDDADLEDVVCADDIKLADAQSATGRNSASVSGPRRGVSMGRKSLRSLFPDAGL